jgi:Zn finger protein HypA/HybF involved in hydrogenase expression
MPKPRLKVVCLECRHRFQTTNDLPECPRCGGTDIDLADAVGLAAADKAKEWS